MDARHRPRVDRGRLLLRGITLTAPTQDGELIASHQQAVLATISADGGLELSNVLSEG
jgi:hypothetical protein